MPVARGHAGARVDEEEDRVAVGERRLGLGAHAAGERLPVAGFEPGGVDDGEGKIAEPRFALAPIAGDAGLVVNQRQFAPDEPIEQRRLADVRPPDDGDFHVHGRRLNDSRLSAGARSARRSLGRRPIGGDEAEQVLGAALFRVGRFGVGDDEIEPFAGAVVIARVQRDDAEGQPRGVAIDAAACGQRLERGLGRVGLAGVQAQQGGAQPGGVLEQRADRSVGGEGVIGGKRALGIGLGLDRRRGEPRQRPVAARRVGGDLGQGRLGFGTLAGAIERQGLLKLRPRRLLRRRAGDCRNSDSRRSRAR